ncbi:MAG: PorT family protein [Spirochaetaceae bacterium]|nr:PorT family protein [Spirochaetaceae bacterium]
MALMTFVGDDFDISAQFQESVTGEVDALGGYSIQPVSAERYPESRNFSPDQPPEPIYLGDTKYVLTGEYYVDLDDLQHFQLWLWNSNSGSLVYTDEMVFEDMEEAEGYLPPMVSWIFSHIPVEQRIAVVENVTERVSQRDNEAEEDSGGILPYNRRFFLGVRGGGLFNSTVPQTSGDYEGGVSQGFSGEGAVLAEFRIFRFLGVQAEAVFIYDTFKAAKKTQKVLEVVRSTDTFRSMSLIFPLLIKVPLEVGRFTLSPFVGVYYAMPLGRMKIVPNDPDETSGFYTYKIDPPFGVTLGIDAGLPIGPGELFAGLRFNQNIGMTKVQNQNRMEYTRYRIGLSLGYEFLIWKRR